MNDPVVSAIFEDRFAAENAVRALRVSGIPDGAIGVIGRHTGEAGNDHDDDTGADNKASGMLKGLGVGAGVGAVFGLGALVIPGVGPFIAAGTLIEGLGIVGSAAASGAVVGGAAGGISGALMKYGVSEEDAHHYEKRIREGDVWVAVDTRRTDAHRDTILDLLHQAGGTSPRAGSTTATT